LSGPYTRHKDLAASVGIEGPSMVRLLDTLIDKGFLERSEDASDRRSKLLRLPPEGQKVDTNSENRVGTGKLTSQPIQ